MVYGWPLFVMESWPYDSSKKDPLSKGNVSLQATWKSCKQIKNKYFAASTNSLINKILFHESSHWEPKRQIVANFHMCYNKKCPWNSLWHSKNLKLSNTLNSFLVNKKPQKYTLFFPPLKDQNFLSLYIVVGVSHGYVSISIVA